MNMYLFISIVGTALFFASIRWLHRRHQAKKTGADMAAREQRLHSRRMKDSGFSEPPSEPFVQPKVTEVPELLFPEEGRPSDYHDQWPDGFWSPTIPAIIPDIPVPFPGKPKSYVVFSNFPPETKEIHPRFD